MKVLLTMTTSALGAMLLLGGLAPADAAEAQSTPAAVTDQVSATKLDSGLQLLASAATGGERVTDATGLPATSGDSLVSGTRVEDGNVLVDAYVTGAMPAVTAALRTLGMKVTAIGSGAPQRLVEGWLPADSLLGASALTGITALVGVPAETTDAGSTLSQGDAAQRGPEARSLGASGAGVKVGVISDSINQVGGGIASSQASGDLPSSVTVLKDDDGGSDEGRAMAEIIYDGAPGVDQMYFASGSLGAQSKAGSIDALVASGVKVIADDNYYTSEPMFQDGVVAQAVDRAKAAGVTYLASAGNRGNQSWEGIYAPTTDPRLVSSTANDFDTSTGADAKQTVGTFTDTRVSVALQWDEAWGKAQTDLAIDVYTDGTYLGSTTTNNLTTGLPYEYLGVDVTGTKTVEISIRRVSGTRSPVMKYIASSGSPFSIAEYPTGSSAVNPDAASASGALAVAATRWSTPTTPEPFSSRGPSVTKVFDKDGNRLATPSVRAKPAVAAADGVATSVPGFLSFFGTSAATPSAAATAALVRSVNPALSVDQVAAILTDPANANACIPAAACGSGFLLADRAVAAAGGAAPLVTETTSNGAPTSATGWRTGDVTVTWSVAGATSTTGCDTVRVTTDGVRQLTCTASSPQGTTSRTVTIKRDTTGPVVGVQGLKKKYRNGAKLKKNSLHCVATDATSGVVTCTLRGFSRSPGRHAMTVTATDAAGNVSRAVYSYTVAGGKR